ncbi:TPM domain-containing protein [Candidatus Uhrbacteria bacterium]|nr:TPM domain-containing protein [Candidatus Uhrbacteria bacterium]
MKFFQRLIDLWWMHRMFSKQDLDAITVAVTKAEQTTSGEIRVVIRARRDDSIPDVKTQAEADFLKHKMHDTRDKTGVLLLIVLADRAFYIMGDEGINNLLPPNFWEQQAIELSSAFHERHSTKGICESVEAIGRCLCEHFPKKHDDTNELPNRPVLEV